MMKDKKIFFIVDVLLGLGCIGFLEMIIASFNWHTIMHNDTFLILRPGKIGAQITVFLLLIGFFGLLTWFFGLFNAVKRSLKIRNILALVFFLEFIAVVYLYQGIFIGKNKKYITNRCTPTRFAA